MIRYIMERLQTALSRQGSWLRMSVAVALGVALMVALLVASHVDMFALQHDAVALLTPYLNHTPTLASSYDPTGPTCGGISLPC